jgi:hypothetical protein
MTVAALDVRLGLRNSVIEMADYSEDQKRELKRRLELLREQLEAGRMHFAPHLVEETKKSLMAVRYGPNGEIDLDTVDGRVRSMALAVAAMHDRDKVKQEISLADIQQTYFRWLDESFGHLQRFMIERGLNPHSAGRAAAADPAFVKETIGVIPKFMEVLTEFWDNLGEPAHIHVEDARNLKAVFGGDLFPSAYQNIASTCGIYIDTIILPDPFLRSADLFERWTPERRTYYFVKHALNVLAYRELALAAVEPPILAVLPDRTALDEQRQDLIGRVARADAIIHAGRVFDRTFSSFDEALEFVDSFEDMDSVVAALVRPERFLFDVEWEEPTRAQIERALREQPELQPFVERPGRLVLMQAVGRMGQSNDLLLRTQRLGGTPLIDAATSWRYLQWKLEYDASRLPEPRTEELHVTRALQAASGSGRIGWLGRIPPSALIELRRQGALHELRSLVGDGVARLAGADPTDFGSTAELVVANLDKMFADHEAQMRQVSAKISRFGWKDVGSWLVIGGVEVAAAATGMPLYGLAALAGNQVLDVPKLKDFPGKVRELIEESRSLRRSPVGLLFQYRD